MKPVIAIVSCYNQGEIIMETIDSLLNQSYKNLKIVIVDDGSTDIATIHLLKKLAIEYTTKIEVYFKENGHVSAARNYGIKGCNSEYIFISDGDDTYSSQMIEKFVHELENNPEVGIVSSWIKTFGLAEWLVKPTGGDVINFLHKNNCPGQAMIRRICWEETGGYDENMKAGYEDWDFYIAVTSKGWKVSIIEEPLINYRIATKSGNIEGYKKRLELITYIVKKHQSVYEKYLLDVILEKEKAFQEKNLEVLKRVRTIDDLPEVTFGDGGMAFAITAFSLLDAEKNKN